MAWFNYGYFVRQPDGSIVPAGHDFVPTVDSYKVGDSLGVRGDSEGFVIGILKGEEAKLAGGYDVFILVEQRHARGPGSFPPPPRDFFQRDEGRQFVEQLRRGPARLVSRPQIPSRIPRLKVSRRRQKTPCKAAQREFLRLPGAPPSLAVGKRVVRS
jgi:hypothetical protein